MCINTCECACMYVYVHLCVWIYVCITICVLCSCVCVCMCVYIYMNGLFIISYTGIFSLHNLCECLMYTVENEWFVSAFVE